MVSAETPTAPEYQQEIADVLRALFGTPDEPFALPETGLDLGRLRLAAGSVWSDEKGSHVGLYRKHCVHCHGITGDGRGPVARFLSPYPRDYRPAVYKFKSTLSPARPTDEDLHRILVNGVQGTAMPSFALLPSSEIESLVEYVKYLSMRGQLETELIRYVYDELGEEETEDENGESLMRRIPLDPSNDADQQDAIMEMLADIVEGWNEAEENVIVPEVGSVPAEDRTAEEVAVSISMGRELFYGAKANCNKCHGQPRPDDKWQEDYDIWNKARKKFLEDMARSRKGEQTEQDRALAASRKQVAASLYPVRPAIARSLQRGIYHGGGRRIDIFWRIYAGIAGTPMPATGPTSPGEQGTLTEEEMWSLVDYVLSLPNESPSKLPKALPASTNEVF